MQKVAARYARALAIALGDGTKLTAAHTELAVICPALATLVAQQFFARTTVKLAEKEAVLQKTLADASAPVLNLLRLLLAKKRFTAVGYLPAAVAAEIARLGGEQTATIETATTLTKESETELAKILASKLGHPVKIETHENAALLAGMRVTLDDTVYDLSLARQLANLGRALMS